MTPNLTDKPLIRVHTFQQPFEAPVLEQIERVLPQFVHNQRWFRAKTKTIRRTSIEDAIPLSGGAVIAIVRLQYADDEHEAYFLPITMYGAQPGWDDTQILARVQDDAGEERLLYNSLEDPEFRFYLLDAIACDRKFKGSGALIGRRSEAFELFCEPHIPRLKSNISRAEQSNSSIVFENRYILKLFRKLETGVNPDIEIGKFLTRQGFAHSPPVLGEIQYETAAGETAYMAILQKFVPNAGDAWKHALDSVAAFFEHALQNPNPPVLRSYDSFDLIAEELPSIARQTIGEYIESAKLLGTRTAQMHSALSSDAKDPDFAPEPFTPDYAELLYREMIDEADRAFTLLRQKLDTLPAEAANDANKLVSSEQLVRNRFASLRKETVKAMRIRHHGDYHLGQVLYTGDDFVIIDFEGEPARPLAARRAKTLAMRDVAGMIRSFSYAAYAGLFAHRAGESTDGKDREAAERWAAFWIAWVGAEYLKGYFEEAEGALFTEPDRQRQKLLLDVFLLQKALYETTYELNNRPDWVKIPLRGILSLVD